MNILALCAPVRRLLAALLVALHVLPAGAVTYEFRIDTAALAAQAGGYAFEFISNSGNAGNRVTLDGFSTTATLAASSTAGSVTGTLLPGPVTFTGATFFNEFLQRFTLMGTGSQFRIDTATAAAPGPVPDSFAFYVLDSLGVPLATSDPSGANALLVLTLAGPPALQVYTATGVAATLVPEPAPWVLMLAAGAWAAGTVRRRHRPAW